MEKGARSSDIFDFPNFLNEIRIKVKLKFSGRMLVGNSHHYSSQLVDKKRERENLTPLNFQTFLNEIYLRIKLNLL